MKVNAFFLNQRIQNRDNVKTTINSNHSHLLGANKHQSFGLSLETGFKMSRKLKMSLYLQKLLATITGQPSNVKYYNLGLLEGLQEGIEVFKGLKLKHIAFLGEDLHSVTAKRGCYSHCSYCYPGAKKPIKPTESAINSILFEDFKALADGFKTLRKRSGINFIHNNSKEPYQTLVFDSDNIEIAVKDLKNNIHEFPELNKMLYDATGKKGIFDTSGWNFLNENYQKRAERIVEYYSKAENMEELHQFNISINPFHSTLIKVNELKAQGKTESAKRIYEKHIEKMANTLFTCIPLRDFSTFGTIKRAFGWNVPNMEGYYFTDELDILRDIFKRFSSMCKEDFKTNQKYIKSKVELDDVLWNFADRLEQKGDVIPLNDLNIDTNIIGSPKLEKFVRERNPQMKDFQFFELFKNALRSDERFDRIKQFKKYRSAYLNYLKMIDANGKVYLTDSYKVIPTDLQLNFINRNKQTQPFSTLTGDFVLTEKML